MYLVPLVICFCSSGIHTQKHNHIHDTYIIHTYMNIYIQTDRYTQTHGHIYRETHTDTHSYTQRNTHSHTKTQSHIHSYIQPQSTHMQSHTDIYT